MLAKGGRGRGRGRGSGRSEQGSRLWLWAHSDMGPQAMPGRSGSVVDYNSPHLSSQLFVLPSFFLLTSTSSSILFFLFVVAGVQASYPVLGTA